MKKIFEKVCCIKNKVYQLFVLLLYWVVDFFFCIRLFIDLHNYKNYFDFNHLKVFLQFTANSFDDSSFEYYNLDKEESLYLLYLSLKKKNSLIFQVFVFFHCFFINYLLHDIIYILLPCSNFNFKNKFIDNTFDLWNKELKKQIENNFRYEYLRDYKRYYYSDKEYYNSIKYKVFFFESIINICDFWNKYFIKDNRKSKLFINTNNLFFDIERYF